MALYYNLTVYRDTYRPILKNLEDINVDVLKKMIAASVKYYRAKYK